MPLFLEGVHLTGGDDDPGSYVDIIFGDQTKQNRTVRIDVHRLSTGTDEIRIVGPSFDRTYVRDRIPEDARPLVYAILDVVGHARRDGAEATTTVRAAEALSSELAVVVDWKE